MIAEEVDDEDEGKQQQKTSQQQQVHIGRSTGPVDRTTCSAAVVLFSAAVSFAFRRDFLGDHLDNPSAIHVNFLGNNLSHSNNSPPRRRFFKSEPISNATPVYHLAKSTHDLGLRAPVEINTRSRLGIFGSSIPGKHRTCLPCTSP